MNVASVAVVEKKISCNRCGHEMDCENNNYEEFMTDMIHKFTVTFGYASDLDTQTWYFDLCENCLKEIVATFKIPHEVDNW
jgi:hypothetical protein